MKLSFCTLGCPAWTRPQCIQEAQKLGYDGIEFRGTAGEHLGPQEPADDLKALVDDMAAHRVEAACIMGYSRFTWDDPAQREKDVNIAIQYCHTAKAIGCPTLRIFGGNWCEAGREESIRRVVENIKKIVPAAEETGTQLAIETHDDWCVGENIMAVIHQVNSPRLGICWDVSNASFHEPIETTFAAIKDHISHVHFKDAAKIDGKVKSQLPGTGTVDMKLALKLLHDHGYNKYLSFEWEKKWEADLAEPEVAFPHYLNHAKKLMQELGVPRG